MKRLVLVSGAPGAGKSTLAVPLAAALGFALISKDHVKETLFDALKGPKNDRTFSRKIGGAAMELLWTLAARCPSVVLEANFRPHSAYEQERIAQLSCDSQTIEVYCRCPPQEAARRFAARFAAGTQHPAHPLAQLSPEMLAEFDRPVGVGTLIEVDTTKPVAIDALCRQIQQVWKTS